MFTDRLSFTNRMLRPYSRYVEAIVRERDERPAMKAIADLPLSRRFVWLASVALEILANCEMGEIDQATMCAEDIETLTIRLEMVSKKWCLLLAGLFGHDQMREMIDAGLLHAYGACGSGVGSE